MGIEKLGAECIQTSIGTLKKAVATKDEKIVGQLGTQLKEISAEASESLTNLRKGEILANA